MLPFFFKHYDNIVDQYFIFDNGSTDGSVETLRSHPKVNLRFIKFKGKSFVLAALTFYNMIWKRSKGEANWVIICNIDEHLYHSNLRNYLQECSESGYTLIKPVGFEMVSRNFPEHNQPLTSQIRMGVRNIMFDKPQLFQPDSIHEINFQAGRHKADPLGDVRLPVSTEVKLLHYKYLGEDYYNKRLSELSNGLREIDIERNFGHKYKWSEQQKISHFRKLLAASVQVI